MLTDASVASTFGNLDHPKFVKNQKNSSLQKKISGGLIFFFWEEKGEEGVVGKNSGKRERGGRGRWKER
jgi:hypothetical protein